MSEASSVIGSDLSDAFVGLVPFVGVMQMWDKRYGLLRSPSTRLDTGVVTCATLAQLLYGLTALRVAQAEGGKWKKRFVFLCIDSDQLFQPSVHNVFRVR